MRKLLLIAVALWLAGCAPAAASEPEVHWAFVSPRRPPVPSTDWPGGAQQPIDAFLAERLAAEGLAPSAPADRSALLRRLSLVLTGLPPTVEERAAYLNDAAPDAYERLVDRLQASPRYGERMAVDWLDLARYADTHGYHSDSARVMWPWRDWVIEALNADLPFDQFTIEQLAGDLLPGATTAQRVATGLHRNHMLNDENGAIPAEYLAEYVADRVATTGTIWLGLTLACARCHDHKYDPIRQREFYELFAFFHNVPENGLGGKTGNAPPTLAAPTRLQQAELHRLTAEITALEARLAARESLADDELDAWCQRRGKQETLKLAPPADARIALPFDGLPPAADEPPSGGAAKIQGNAAWVAGKSGQALLCDGQTYVELPSVPVWGKEQPFSLAAWVFPTTGGTLPIVARVDTAQEGRGFSLVIENGRLALALVHAAGQDELVVRTQAVVKQRRWQHVAATYDGSGQAAGVGLYLDGQPLPTEALAATLRGHIQGDEVLTIGRSNTETFFRGMLDEVRMFTRPLAVEEVAVLAGREPLAEILAVPPMHWSGQQREWIKRSYLERFDPAYAADCGKLAALRGRRNAVLAAAPLTMVMQELPEPRPTFLLLQGRYDQPGERVVPGTPRVLPPLPPGAPRNRLGLARWLVHPGHPLTRRVAVNRAWQAVFGAGLVRTPDDFGLRGDRPTHPALLDWLAVEFARGWDLKRLHRHLVTAAAFRQASAVRPDLLARDPENLLLARGPRYRLPAETIRDQALAAGGLLDLRIGGPSVRPYQPAELWRELAYDPDARTAQIFTPSQGADLYRRSLYTFWKRTVPPPNLALLDAPDRELCTAVRPRTASPLQALVLWNDATFVEAARKLAEGALAAAATDGARVDWLLLAVLGREASARERAILTEQLTAERAAFRRDPSAAQRLLAVGASPALASLDRAELAAWTLVASTVLNLDETLHLR